MLLKYFFYATYSPKFRRPHRYHQNVHLYHTHLKIPHENRTSSNLKQLSFTIKDILEQKLTQSSRFHLAYVLIITLCSGYTN